MMKSSKAFFIMSLLNLICNGAISQIHTSNHEICDSLYNEFVDYKFQGEIEKSLHSIDKAIECNDNPIYRLARANVYWEEGLYTACLNDLHYAALRIGWRDVDYEIVVQCYISLDDLERAKFYSTEWLKKSNYNFKALEWRARILADQGEFALAEEDISECLRKNPDYINANATRALIRIGYQNWKGAASDWETYLLKEPNDIDALNQLGICYNMSLQYEKSIRTMNKIIELESTNVEARLTKLMAKFMIGDYYGCIVDCDKLLGMEINSSQKAGIYQTRGRSKFFTGDYESALFDLSTSIKMNSRDCQTYKYRGGVYFQLKDKANACKDFSVSGELGCSDAYQTINQLCR